MNINTDYLRIRYNPDANHFRIRVGSPQYNINGLIQQLTLLPNIHFQNRILAGLRIGDWNYEFALGDERLLQLGGLGFCAKGVYQVFRGAKSLANFLTGSALLLSPSCVRAYHSIEHYRREQIRVRIEAAFDNQELSSAQKLDVLCEQFPDESLLIQMIQLLTEHQPLNEDNFLNGQAPGQLPLDDERQILWDFRPYIQDGPRVLSIYFNYQVQREGEQSTGYVSYFQNDGGLEYMSGHSSCDLRYGIPLIEEQQPPVELHVNLMQMLMSFETPQEHINAFRTLLEGNEIANEDIQVQLWQPQED